MLAEIEGGSLYFERVGDGPPLLLMHGGLGLDHHCFRPYLDPLGEHAELIYYDHRGNGGSSEPADWSAVTNATWADDADRLRAHLGLDQIFVIGHSYGGCIAIEYALRYPQHLAGLILSDVSPAFDYPDVMMANAAARGTPEILAGLQAALGGPAPDDETLRQRWEAILPLYFTQLTGEVSERFFATTIFRAKASNHGLECLPRFNVLDRLADIRAPTLILAGADDWICPPEQGAARLTVIPGSELVVLPSGGHFPFVEQNQLFLRTVADWLVARS